MNEEDVVKISLIGSVIYIVLCWIVPSFFGNNSYWDWVIIQHFCLVGGAGIGWVLGKV